MRYAGPADALWRLMALDAFDLSGPVEIAADMSGTLDDPSLRGSLAGKGMRLQSAASGTDVSNVEVRGDFTGSALSLSSLSGQAPGGGLVSGSGRVDFAQMGPGRVHRRCAGRAAGALISRPDMALSATGPIRIMSDGVVGTIAGRLTIDSARWRLGQASSTATLPSLPTKEINRRADIAPASEREMPWRLMVDAAGGNIRLSGLGLNSLWNADVKLRGVAGPLDQRRGHFGRGQL
jgi:translocation and assembly module TamB